VVGWLKLSIHHGRLWCLYTESASRHGLI
jgi:hypothetical protein